MVAELCAAAIQSRAVPGGQVKDHTQLGNVAQVLEPPSEGGVWGPACHQLPAGTQHGEQQLERADVAGD